MKERERLVVHEQVEERVEPAGQAGERRRDDEGERAGGGEVDAERLGGVLALRGRAHGAAVARMDDVVLDDEGDDQAARHHPEIDRPRQRDAEHIAAGNSDQALACRR